MVVLAGIFLVTSKMVLAPLALVLIILCYIFGALDYAAEVIFNRRRRYLPPAIEGANRFAVSFLKY